MHVQVTSKMKGEKRMVCYGCGADIVPKSIESDASQTQKAARGKDDVQVTSKRSSYWAEKAENLRKSKISNWALCPRCKELSKSSMSDSVYTPTGVAMEAFRNQVQKIRSQHAVVICVVDAVNVAGTIIKKLRDYVGGNPILLAVTRCDLLPSYYDRVVTNNEVALDFSARAKELNVAEVFLVSLPPKSKKDKGNRYDDREDDFYSEDEELDDLLDGDDHYARKKKQKKKSVNPGVAQLAAAILKKRKNRDVYVVGAANIGKSTLTDALVDELVAQQSVDEFKKDGHMAEKRLGAIKRMRVTQSALPGTTLQNIRVPCFLNHEQALWDTPGLLMDVSKHHFPIRNFEKMQRSQPAPVWPVQVESTKGTFLVQIGERGDDERLPLLRMVVRLKKNKSRDSAGDSADSKSEPTRLVWNSIFGLEAKVFEKPVGPPPELEALEKEMQIIFDNESDNETQHRPNENLTPEERKARREERKRKYEARIKAEKVEMGLHAWNQREKERRDKRIEFGRETKLRQLTKIGQIEIKASQGMDVAIENLGWFGFLGERDALLEIYAPSKGVQVKALPALSLPETWGWNPDEKDKGEDKKDKDEASPDSDDEWGDDGDDEEDDWWKGVDDEYNDYGYEDVYDDGLGGSWADSTDDYADDDWADAEGPTKTDKEFPNDPWSDYAGTNIGFEFLGDGRFSKTLSEGWNRIREERDESKKKGKESVKEKKVDWKPPLSVKYHVEYPESKYSGRRESRSRGGRRYRGKSTPKPNRYKGKSTPKPKMRGDPGAAW